jgi:FAD/FMN-containing dehydrogenase
MITKTQLIKIVGARNISTAADDLNAYADDLSFVNPVRPAAVIRPRTVVEVQPLVALANKTGTPLVTVSSGPPHFHGDTVPATGGAIILDLSGLKKIIRVDRYHRVAMVEAGVTFGELVTATKKEGIRLNMPLLPKKNKSVVASMLEREPVMMPKYQWDMSDPLACLGLVWGTGDEFRTGQAAGPGTIEEQWAAGGVQKAPYGPGRIAWHRLVQGAQGTMAIVTWASLRCELLPVKEGPSLVGSESLDKLLELARWLIRRRLVNECFVLNRSSLAVITAKRWPRDYRQRFDDLPSWVLFFSIAGYEYFPEERVAFQRHDILELTKQLALEPVAAIGGVAAADLLELTKEPCDDPHWKLRYKGACEDILFLAVNRQLDELTGLARDLADAAGYAANDLGMYIQPLVQGTSNHCEINLFYDPDDARETARIKALSSAMTRELINHGAFFSRPYGAETHNIINRDAASVRALTKIKQTLDPNSILNPGKLGF